MDIWKISIISNFIIEKIELNKIKFLKLLILLYWRIINLNQQMVEYL